MLLSHAFSGARLQLFTPIIYIGNRPLILWLIGACSPIPFFMMLSGYGLACKFEISGISPHKQFPRVLRLYIYYWVILAIFLTIGHFINPALYPGSLMKLLKNMLGWDTTYNSPMWFLLPYSILSIVSLYIIQAVVKVGNLWSVAITLFINLSTSFTISRFGPWLNDNMIVYQPLLCFHLLMWFTMGVVLKRTSLKSDIELPPWGAAAAIILLVVITCLLNSPICYYIYAPALVILLCHVKWPCWISAILLELGRKSMPIWMIHTWLSHYLFVQQIYSPKYIPLIFIALLAASYLISIPVIWIADRIYRLVTRMACKSK